MKFNFFKRMFVEKTIFKLQEKDLEAGNLKSSKIQ